MPLILSVAEEFRLSPRPRYDGDIAAHLRGRVDQERSEIVPTRGCRRWSGRGAGAEAENSAWPERLGLHQVVAQAPEVNSPLEGVILADFRPIGHRVDVGLAPVPRQGRRITNHRARESALNVNGGHAAGEGVQIDTGDAQDV